MKYFTIALLILGLSLYAMEKDLKIDSTLISGLIFRNIGPAFSSSRVADIAIHPVDEQNLLCSHWIRKSFGWQSRDRSGPLAARAVSVIQPMEAKTGKIEYRAPPGLPMHIRPVISKPSGNCSFNNSGLKKSSKTKSCQTNFWLCTQALS